MTWATLRKGCGKYLMVLAVTAAAVLWADRVSHAAVIPDKTNESEEITFFIVSDTHYGLSQLGDEEIPKLVDKMNGLPGTHYPAAIGGQVGKPCGVIHVGDITNDGKQANWDKFVKDYGLDGSDGRLKFPVYETFGNHDGGAKLPVREGIKLRNQTRVDVKDVSDNRLHYSWDWGKVHFVMMGISPGTTKHPYDPANSTEFAVKDLAKNVGLSGRPVILIHHFGFDKEHSWNWWPDEWKTQYHDAIKDYNVIGILHGHAHKSFIYKWEGIDIYHPPHYQQDVKNNGPVKHGFFVFHITSDELTVAERKLDDTWGMTSKKQLKPSAEAEQKK